MMTEKAQRIIIGKNVREERKDWGWTQEDLADRTGLTENTIRNIENGITNPSMKAIVAIANAFNIDTWVLFADSAQRDSVNK